MPATVSLLNNVVTVEPGSEGVGMVRVRNTGVVVDQFTLSMVGDAAAWATFEPPTVSLLPDNEQTVTIRFRPPRNSTVAAGAVDFGVRVVAQEDAGFSVVEEGTLQIGGFAGVTMKVVPRTSQGKRGADHRVEIHNTGNTATSAVVRAQDPDDLLVFKITPAEVEVPPGETAVARIRVASKKGPKGRVAARRPFTVSVQTPGPVPVAPFEAAFEQRARRAILVPLLIVAIIAGIAIWFTQQDANAAVPTPAGADATAVVASVTSP